MSRVLSQAPIAVLAGDRSGSRRLRSQWRRFGTPVWMGILLGSLLLVMLRVDVLRMRYAKSELLKREQELTAIRRELLVERNGLLHPDRLSRLAAERGFETPARIHTLPRTAPAGPSDRP